MPLMKRISLILAWIAVFVTAAFLRFDDLTLRPMHADEATGARIMAMRMEGQGGKFNPSHYHGPLLADLTMPICLLRGESSWAELSKLSLRPITACAGFLLVLLPLAWRRSVGDLAPLLAAALLATSPLLIYYSRMFIHESLLALAGMAFLAAVLRWPRWGIPGVLLGLMFAAKETVVISVLAWTVAVALLLVEQRRAISRESVLEWLRVHGRGLILSGVAALLTSLVLYTHGFTHWRGAWDAVRTFFIYETVEGHDKPWSYYLQLLAWPQKAAGVWWFGTPVVLLAVWAYASSWSARLSPSQGRLIRFLGHGVLGHLLIYSLFAYKTPWLALLPWAMTCWLAGLGFIHLTDRTRWVQVGLVLLMVTCLASQWRQSRLANVRYHSDARNPFAYVPTRPDLESLEEWLGKLRAMEGGEALDRAAVVGSGYWPLPWYLRSLGEVGYWPSIPDDVETYPLVLAMPEHAPELEGRMEESHVPLPRGLRDGVPLQMYLGREVWDLWMKTP